MSSIFEYMAGGHDYCETTRGASSKDMPEEASRIAVSNLVTTIARDERPAESGKIDLHKGF